MGNISSNTERGGILSVASLNWTMRLHWLEQTEADLPPHDDWLTADEAAHLNTLRFPKRRADWRLGRWTAKHAIAAHLNFKAQDNLNQIEIRPASSGAPEAFIGGKPAPVTISLSHRDGTAICAVTESGIALGCDLELIEPRSDAFISDYLTGQEQAAVAHASTADRALLVTLIWSAKESSLKALRAGLRADTRSVVVSLPNRLPTSQPNDEWHPLHVRYTDGHTQLFHGWWQQTGSLLRTLVADPPPPQPIMLRVRSDLSPLRIQS